MMRDCALTVLLLVLSIAGSSAFLLMGGAMKMGVHNSPSSPTNRRDLLKSISTGAFASAVAGAAVVPGAYAKTLSKRLGEEQLSALDSLEAKMDRSQEGKPIGAQEPEGEEKGPAPPVYEGEGGRKRRALALCENKDILKKAYKAGGKKACKKAIFDGDLSVLDVKL